MVNQVQLLAPEGQEYLIKIAKHFDQVSAAQYNSSGMSFTTGLLLGQFSVVLLVIVCFKYLLLEDVRYGRKVIMDPLCQSLVSPTFGPLTPHTNTFFLLLSHDPFLTEE